MQPTRSPRASLESRLPPSAGVMGTKLPNPPEGDPSSPSAERFPKDMASLKDTAGSGTRSPSPPVYPSPLVSPSPGMSMMPKVARGPAKSMMPRGFAGSMMVRPPGPRMSMMPRPPSSPRTSLKPLGPPFTGLAPPGSSMGQLSPTAVQRRRRSSETGAGPRPLLEVSHAQEASRVSRTVRPFRKSFLITQQPDQHPSMITTMKKLPSRRLSEIPPVESPLQDEEDTSEEGDIGRQGAGAPDELVVMERETSSEERKTRKKLRKKKTSKEIRKTEKGDEAEEEVEEAYMYPYEQKRKLDVWLPFIDRGTMYSAYQPKLPYYGYRTTYNSRCRLAPSSSALNALYSSFPGSAPPFPVMRRSYFLPSSTSGGIPVHVRAAHPSFAPPFAYHYNRTGVMQSSPPSRISPVGETDDIGGELQPMYHSSSATPANQIASRRRGRRSSGATQSDVEPFTVSPEREDIQLLSEALRTDAAVAGRAFNQMENILAVQSRQIEMLTSSLQYLHTQVDSQNNELRATLQKKNELENQLVAARRSRVADKSLLDELLRRAERRLAAAVTTGERLGMSPASLDRQQGSFFGQPWATGTVAVIPDQESAREERRKKDKKKKRVRSRESSSNTSSSSARTSSPSSESERDVEILPKTRKTKSGVTSTQLTKASTQQIKTRESLGTQRIGAKRFVQPIFDETIPPELQTVLVRPCPDSCAKATFVVIREDEVGGPVDIVDVQTIVNENERLHETVGVLEKKLAASIAELRILSTTAAKAREQLDMAGFARREAELLQTENAQLRNEVEIEKGKVSKLRSIIAIAKAEAKRAHRTKSPEVEDELPLYSRKPPSIPTIITTRVASLTEREQNLTYDTPNDRYGIHIQEPAARVSTLEEQIPPTRELFSTFLPKEPSVPREALLPREEDVMLSYRSRSPSSERREAELNLRLERDRQQQEVEDMFERALQKQVSFKEIDIEILRDTVAKNQHLTTELARTCHTSTQKSFNLLTQSASALSLILMRTSIAQTVLQVPTFREPISPTADPLRCVGYCHQQLEDTLMQFEDLLRQAAHELDTASLSTAVDATSRLSQIEAVVEAEREQGKEIEAKYAADIKRHLQKVEEQARVLAKAGQEIEILRKRAIRAADADRLESELTQLRAAKEGSERRIDVLTKTIEENAAEFNRRLEAGRRHFEQIVGERDALRRDCDELQDEKGKLQSDLKTMTELLRKAEETILDLSPENRDRFIDVLALKAKSTDAQITVLHRQLHEMKRQQAGADRIRIDLRQQLEEAKKGLVQLEDMFKQVNLELKEKVRQLGEERAESLARERLYKETKLRNDFVEQELKEHVKTIEQKTKKIEEIMENREKFKEALRIVGDRARELEYKLEDTENLLSKERATTARLAEAVDKEKTISETLKANIQNLEDHKRKLREQLDRGDLILMRRAAELEEAMGRLEKKTEELREANSKIIDLEKQTREMIEQINERRMSGSMLEEKWSFSERQRDIGDRRYDTLKTDLENAQNELVAAKSEVDSLRHTLETIRLSESQATARYQATEAELRRMMLESSRLNETLREQSTMNQELRARIESLKKQQEHFVHRTTQAEQQKTKAEGGLSDFGVRMEQVLRQKDEALEQAVQQRYQREQEWKKSYGELQQQLNLLIDNLQNAGINSADYMVGDSAVGYPEDIIPGSTAPSFSITTPAEILRPQPEGEHFVDAGKSLPQPEKKGAPLPSLPIWKQEPKIKPTRSGQFTPTKQRVETMKPKVTEKAQALSSKSLASVSKKPFIPQAGESQATKTLTIKKKLPIFTKPANIKKTTAITRNNLPIEEPEAQLTTEGYSAIHEAPRVSGRGVSFSDEPEAETVEMSQISPNEVSSNGVQLPLQSPQFTLHLNALGFDSNAMAQSCGQQPIVGRLSLIQPPVMTPQLLCETRTIWNDSEFQPTPKGGQQRYQVEGRLRFQPRRSQGRRSVPYHHYHHHPVNIHDICEHAVGRLFRGGRLGHFAPNHRGTSWHADSSCCSLDRHGLEDTSSSGSDDDHCSLNSVGPQGSVHCPNIVDCCPNSLNVQRIC